jgi:single-stranded-DNA-specific exonuclease
MIKKRWVVLNENGKDLRKVLIKNRKIRDKEAFFKPHLHKLTSPDELFSDLDRAVERVRKAIKNKELIYIYGDFDVDGVTGTAILWETIDFLGGKCLPYIPHREKEGYGINADTIKSLAKEGAKVIISVDCGITAMEEAKIAKELSVDFIITDHHEKQKILPKSFAILHTEDLAGSGVAFMLAKALLESFSKKDDEQLYKNLELATIGTVADMAPLIGDNRIISSNGFHNLAKSSRIGLRALYDEASLTKKIGPYEVGFIISPRLNAAGRMEHALDALRLLLTRNKKRASELATKLSETNRQRQEATAAALSHARETVNGNGVSKMIVVHHSSYPQGVIGLVAGKLADEFYRPSIVISEASPLSRGSARSISGFNITEAISSLKKHLTTHGGHPMAAGFALEPGNIPHFRDKILNYAEKNLKKEDLVPTLKIDTSLNKDGLNYKTLEVLSEFEPFGIGNPEPVFLTKNLEVADLRRLGREGKHLRMVLRSPDSYIYNAIGFGMGDNNVKVGDLLDTVYNLKEDDWRGNKRVELKLKDFRTAES